MRKRRNVEEVETGELLNELSLRSFLDLPALGGICWDWWGLAPGCPG